MKYSHHPISQNLPDRITHVDVNVISALLKKNDFEIDVVKFFGDENGDLPEGIKYDDRERVGAIGTKKGAR